MLTPRPILSTCLFAPTLLLLAHFPTSQLTASESAPNVIWGESATPGKPPNDWTWYKSESPSATIAFANDQLVLTGEPGSWSFIQRNLTGLNGTDEKPLVISCAIAAEGRGALTHLPALLVVRWSERDLLAIGLIDLPERRGDDSASWSGWLANGKRGDVRGQVEPYHRDSPLQVRVVVTSKVILSQASRDGYDWRTVASLPREGSLAAAPTSIELGHGWLKPEALDGKFTDAPKDGKPVKDKNGALVIPMWRFSGLRVGRIGNDLPAALTSTYQRKESGDDTRDTIFATSLPTEWQIAGPFTADKDPLANGNPDAAGVTWKTLASTGKASDRILQLDDQSPGIGSLAVRYAKFVITCDHPRQERFLFDGLRETTIIVNGRDVVIGRSANDKNVTVDRMGSVAWLTAGDNTILVRVVAAPGKGEARLILRHEPGDPRWRAAVTTRLLTDFPPEPGLMASERMEIGRAWQAAGNLQAAADAYGEAATTEDAPSNVVVDALTAQARVNATLHNDAGQAAAVSALSKAWAEDGSDALGAALRGARLHALLGRNDLAVESLNQAMQSATSSTARLSIAAERMRLRRTLGQNSKLAEELLALANSLPVEDARRVALLTVAAREAIRPAPGSTTPSATPNFNNVKTAALASKRPADLQLATFAALTIGDAAGAKTLAKMLTTVVTDNDPLLIFGGEISGDELVIRAALKRYLATRGVAAPEKASLPDLRLRLIRAEISATPEGAQLLAAADKLQLKPDEQLETSNQRTWKAIGPFNNDGWKCYDKPPIDPAKPDTNAAVDGKQWKDVTTKGSEGIDINGIGLGADNAVVLFTTVVTSVGANEVVLSCGADDGLVIWLNGDKVYEDRQQRGLTADSLRVPLKLKAGANRLTAMVQNGSGGFGFQARLADSVSTDLAKLLAFAAHPASQNKRLEIASGLLGVLDQMHREGRVEETPLAFAAMRCFPDVLTKYIDASATIYSYCDTGTGPWTALPEAVLNLDRARIAGVLPERSDLAYFGGDRLRRAGAFEAALQLVESSLMTDPDPSAQARSLLQYAAIHSRTGAIQAAIPLFTRVIDDPALDPDSARWAREQLNFLRRTKGVMVRIAPSFEATTSAGNVARLTAAKDIDGVILAAQKLIEGGADFILPDNDGVGHSSWAFAVAALHSLGDPAVEAYRAKFQARADSALRSAALSSDAAACERVALRWPLCSTTGPALVRAAELYRDAGDMVLAKATAAESIPVLTVPTLITQANAVIALAVKSEVTPTATTTIRVNFPVAPTDAADLSRISNRLTSCTPAICGNTVVLHNGDEAWGIDATTGAPRWRQTGTIGNTERFSGMPSWQTAVADGVIAVRQRGEGRQLAVLRINPTSGEVMWTSAAIPEVSRWTAVSSPVVTPSQVVAAFVNPDDGIRRLVALDSSNGQVRWMTALPGKISNVPALGDLLLNVSGHGAAPTIAGRNLYWCTDTGCVVRLDAANGTLLWAAPYARAVLDSENGESAMSEVAARGVSRTIVFGDQVLVAPRDSLGLIALERTTGVQKWSRPITSIRELAGTVNGPAGKPLLITQGRGVEALDPVTGETVWSLPALSTRGTALCEPGGVFVATDTGVLKLDPSTGKTLATVPWSADQKMYGTLIRSGKSVIAIGEGQLTTVGGAAKLVTLLPTGGATMTFSGLPIQADGTAFGIVAQWPGGSVRQIITSPTSDECYVRTDGLLARISGGASPKIDWQSPLDGDIKNWGLTKDSIFGFQEGVVTLYDRATGQRRATVSSALSPRYAFGGGDFTAWGCPEAIMCFKWGWGHLDVLDPITGERWMRHQFGQRIAAANVRDGKLIVLRHGDGGVHCEVRDARTGAQISDQKIAVDNIDDMRLTGLGTDQWIIGRGERTLFFDLKTLTSVEAENRWHWNNLWPSGSTPVGSGWGIFREGGDRWATLVYNAERKIIYGQEHYKVRPALFSDHAVVQHVDKGVLALVAVHYGDGKDLWRWDADHDWDRWPKALLPVGDRTLVISQKRDGYQRYNLIDAHGKMIGEGPLPGAPGGDVAAQMIGGLLWLGTAQGLAICGPCTPAAMKEQKVGDEVPVAQRTLRDFNLQGFGPPLECGNTTISIDGDLDDWPEEPLRKATSSDHRPPAEAGTAKLQNVTLRSAFDATQVAFAIEVTEPTGAPVTLRLGLDTRGDDGQRPPTPVLEVSNTEGVTKLRLVTGSWEQGVGDLEPTARAMRTLDGWRFEIGLPWPLLRGNKDWRPGDRRWIRYDLLVSAPGDRVEFGQGLATAIDWTLWPGLHFMDQPGKKPRKSVQAIGGGTKR